MAIKILVWFLLVVAYWVIVGVLVIIGEQTSYWNPNGVGKFMFVVSATFILYSICLISSTAYLLEYIAIEEKFKEKKNMDDYS